MLFLVGLVVYLYALIDSPVDLVFPCVAIVARAGYLRREISVSKLAFFVAALALVMPLLVHAYNALGGAGRPIPMDLLVHSLMLAGQVFVGGLFLANASDDPSLTGAFQLLMQPFTGLGVLAQLIEQKPGDVATRVGDIWHTAKFRMGRQGGGLRQRARVIVNAAVAFTIEMTSMANQLNMVVASRGSMPSVSLWKRIPKGIGTVVIADVVLLSMVGLLVSGTKSRSVFAWLRLVSLGG